MRLKSTVVLIPSFIKEITVELKTQWNDRDGGCTRWDDDSGVFKPALEHHSCVILVVNLPVSRVIPNMKYKEYFNKVILLVCKFLS